MKGVHLTPRVDWGAASTLWEISVLVCLFAFNHDIVPAIICACSIGDPGATS